MYVIEVIPLKKGLKIESLTKNMQLIHIIQLTSTFPSSNWSPKKGLQLKGDFLYVKFFSREATLELALLVCPSVRLLR